MKNIDIMKKVLLDFINESDMDRFYEILSYIGDNERVLIEHGIYPEGLFMCEQCQDKYGLCASATNDGIENENICKERFAMYCEEDIGPER